MPEPGVAMNAKAARPEPMPFDDALAVLLRHAAPVVNTEEVSTLEADKRVLAEAVVSPLAVPAWDNSQMDGYAVRCSDLAAEQPQGQAPALRVSQRIAAGQQCGPRLHGGPGHRIRAYTSRQTDELPLDCSASSWLARSASILCVADEPRPWPRFVVADAATEDST